MKLFVLNILISCLLVIKPCLSTEEISNGFLCPHSTETSLVTAVVSGCKVYYTCKNAAVKKIFQCSESPMLAGTTHVCQENPQCPGIDSFEDLLNLPSTIEESKISESDTYVATNDNIKNLAAFMDTMMRFSKCLMDVDNVDDFCKSCIVTTLFQERPFIEVKVSPKVFEAYDKVFNKSKTSEGNKQGSTLDLSFGKTLKDIVQYLSPQCEIVCKDASKTPEHSSGDKLQSEPHISLENAQLSSDDGYYQDEGSAGDRVRRSRPPMSVVDLLSSVLLNRPEMQFPITTTEPPTTPNTARDVNNTLMSKVIVPIIQDLVNDEEALKNATSLVRVVFEALVPLATEILKASNESFNLNRKAIIKIPRQIVTRTIRKIFTDGYPILRSILDTKMPPLLMLLSRNTKLLFRSWDEMESRLEPNMKELRNKGVELLRKYYRVFRSSSTDFIHMYSLIEIQQDIESLYSLLPEISRELLLKNLHVYQDVTGITTESIAKMLLDVPGIFEAMDAIPLEQYVYFLFLLL